MAAVVFFVVVLGIAVLIHLYLYRRLIWDTGTGRRWRRWGAAGALAALLLMIATLIFGERLGPPLGAVLSWPGFMWLALMFYLLVSLLLFELPVLAGRWALRRPVGTTPRPAPDSDTPAETPRPAQRDADPDRRRLLRRGAAVTAGLVATGVTGYGITRAYAPPTITRVQVPLARLDRRADGLRIAVLADIHVGPKISEHHVQRMVEMVNGLRPDLVAVVGDMVSGEAEKVQESIAPLARLESRYGAYFVTGNHEYYTGHQAWIDAAQEVGLRVLRNERLEIAHGGGAIDLAGVNDIAGGEFDDPPDYGAALGDRDPDLPVVLLAHQPAAVRDAARYGVDLQLSGHTHGGQMFPFHLLVRLQQPVVSGLAEVDGTQVYVTNGAGFWGPPVRVGADPEISLIQLRSSS